TVEAKIVGVLETKLPVSAVVFDSASLLATRELDGTVRIWSLATGRETTRLGTTLSDALAMGFAANGELVTFSKSGLVQKWSAKDGINVATLNTNLGLVDRVVMSPMAELAVVFRAKSPDSYRIDKSRRNDDSPWVEEKHCAPCIMEVWDLRQ